MKRLPLLALAALFAVLFVLPVSARPNTPETISLPDGFRPEGIAINERGDIFVGSIPTGAIWRYPSRGEPGILVPAREGRAAIGLDVDQRNRLFVAGGGTGDGYIYDARSGATIAVYNFTDSADTFINDVIVTQRGAYFTDSRQAVIYHVPTNPGPKIPAQDDVHAIALTGDFELGAGNNLNGIVASANGKTLIAVQTNTGKLFRIDPQTGVTDEIELAGDESVPNGDGLLLNGTTLYVVQNRLNLVAKIELADDLGSGEVVSRTSDPDFDVPTTVARKGNTFFLVNARFGTAPTTPDTEYWISTMPRP